MSAPGGWSPDRRALAGLLLGRAFRFGDFRLSSGGRSPYYFDGRQVSLHGPGARLVGQALLALARGDGVSAVGGPAIGADPLATAVALCSALDGGPVLDAFIVRPQPKAHGAGGGHRRAAPAPGPAGGPGR